MKKGFTLGEYLLTLVIIFIFSFLAISNFRETRQRRLTSRLAAEQTTWKLLPQTVPGKQAYWLDLTAVESSLRDSVFATCLSRFQTQHAGESLSVVGYVLVMDKATSITLEKMEVGQP